jgi:hypothetical protein
LKGAYVDKIGSASTAQLIQDNEIPIALDVMDLQVLSETIDMITAIKIFVGNVSATLIGLATIDKYIKA